MQPHGLHHTRLPYPSPTPGACLNSSIKSVMPSNHLVLCRPFLLPSIFSSIRVFSNEMLFTSGGQSTGALASASVFPMNIQDWISFRIDWLDPLVVQRTLKSLLQHHSSKASIIWCSAFFMLQLSHPYMTTGKTIALTIWIFVVKVISLLSNMLSRLVIDFLPRSKHLLISWSHHLQWFWSPRNYIV